MTTCTGEVVHLQQGQTRAQYEAEHSPVNVGADLFAVKMLLNDILAELREAKHEKKRPASVR
jgi:hypothetical protein